MAIAFRSKGAWVAGTTSISMTMPTTHAAGDLLLMFIHTCNNAITTAPANGWALLSPSPVSTGTANTALGVRLTVYWKIAASASEAAQTVAVTSGTATNGITMAFSGVNNTTPFDLTPVSSVAAASTANISCPTLTTATDGAWIVNAIALDNDLASTTSLTAIANASLVSPTSRHHQTVSTSTGGGISVITGTKTTAGLISATTGTIAAAARAYLTIALRPIDMRSGTTSISQASTVVATIIKKGQSSTSISQASSVSVTGVKLVLSLWSKVARYSWDDLKTTNWGRLGERVKDLPLWDNIKLYSWNDLTATEWGLLELTKNATGTTSISQASTLNVTATTLKKGTATISQASTVVATIKTGKSKTASISQASTVVVAIKKGGKSTASISQSSTVSASIRAGKKGLASISQASTVLVEGRGQVIISISAIATLSVSAKAYKRGSVSINAPSSVVVSVKTIRGSPVALNQASTVLVYGRAIKSNQVALQSICGVTVTGKKNAKAITSISQASEVYIAGVLSKFVTTSITANSTVTILGGKKVSSSVSIAETSTVVVNSGKLGKASISIAQGSIITALGKKKGLGAVSTSNSSLTTVTGLANILIIDSVSNLTVIYSISEDMTAIFDINDTITAIISDNIVNMTASFTINNNLTAIHNLEINVSAINTLTQEVVYTMGADAIGETLYMVLGETKIINVEVLTSVGAHATLTGANAKFAIKGMLEKDCTITDNVISVTIEPTETTKSGSFAYEFRLEDISHQVDSLIIGTIKIKQGVVTSMEVEI